MIKKLKYKYNNIKNKNMSETDVLIEPNCKNIFIKIILLGPLGVGKKSLISKINKIKCHKSFPITEEKLKDKCSNIIRYVYSGLTVSFIFFIPSIAQEYEGLQNELSSSDEDTDICNQYHIKFTQTKKDIKTFLTFLYNVNTCYITEYFAFLYDLSNFENTIKDLYLYFQSCNTKFKIKDNFPIILFGTKLDKKTQPKPVKKKELNLFIESLPNVKNYEIGTKSNFDFNHFFAKFIQQILSNNTLINTSHIEQIMEKIEEQQSFSKAPKFEKPKENSSPGPAKYLNNVYDTENIKERINALTGNNRFNTKLFINKKGPQLHEEKLKKPKKVDPFNKFRNKYEMEQKEKLKKVAQYLMEGQKGFSFGGGMGTGQGKKLLEERKKMAEKRNELYYSAFDENYIIGNPNKNYKSRTRSGNRYDNLKINITEDNKSIQSKESKFLTQGKYDSLVKENKSKILEENENKIKQIIERSNKITEEDRKQLKEKYKEIIFGNNSLLLKKTDEKIKEIKNSRERVPTPPMYDISKGLLDKNKGFSILSRKPQINQKINEAPFVYIQSDFDKCTKNQKLGSISYAKRHSFKQIKTENNKKVFDEDKFNKYEKNRINSERHQNTIEFLNDRKEKKNIHNYLMQQIEEKNKELIENLKSSQTQNEFENINYNLVESSSPKYSMRGKYGSDENRENKLLFLNSLRNDPNFELKDYRPNYNYVKPRIQSFKFPKDERFKSNKSESNMNNSKDISESKINNRSKNMKSNNASKSFESDTIELNYEKENQINI
jgi:hypothetical protein